MRLPMDKADQVLRLMLEGMSTRSIERFTGLHRDTILRLMLRADDPFCVLQLLRGASVAKKTPSMAAGITDHLGLGLVA
jgi:hypothetical protein